MTEVLNKKTPTFGEGMEAAAKEDDPEAYLKSMIAADKRWVTLLGYAMNPKYKMGLPDGEPPYKPSQAPMGLAEFHLLQLADKLYVMYNPQLPQYKKEEIFIGWLEKLNPTEAKLLVAIKDKNLHKIYRKVSELKIVSALGWDADQYRKMRDGGN